MKSHQMHIMRVITTSLMISAAMFGPSSRLPADELKPPISPALNWGAGPEEIQSDLGTPAFMADSILIYLAEINTSEGAIEADLTLWFRGDELFFASYAFPVEGRSERELTVQFESISDWLRATYDEPSSRAFTPNSFTTEVWNLDEIDIEHTLILETGRVEHVVTFTASQD